MYATLLLHSAKRPITEENITIILNAAGIQTDSARVKALVTALEEINIDEALKTPIFITATSVASTAEVKEDKKIIEKPKIEEKKEEEDVQGLGALFR